MNSQIDSANKIKPTLSPAEAARTTWPVVIIGAGPAGSSAAIFLAKAGKQVLLVDRASFPRGKVCGCCLNGVTLELLRDLNAGDAVERRGLPIEKIRLATDSRQVELALPGGVSVSRDWFDAHLIQQAIEHGASFLDGVTARILPQRDATVSVRLSEASTVQAEAVIVADGLSGRSLENVDQFITTTRESSWVGVGATLPDASAFEIGVIYMACTKSGYVGMVRLEDGRLDIASAMSRDFLKQKQNVADCISEILAKGSKFNVCPQAIQNASWRGTPQLTRRLNQVAHGRIFVIGDAAGYVEPFTGEGIAWALQGGSAVGRILSQATGDYGRLRQQWIGEHRRLVTSRQATCRWAALILKHPWMTSGVIRLLQIAPSLASPFIRGINQAAVV